MPFCLVWGVTVVADSAQFSACVTELADGEYVGTALTLRTAGGVLLTVGSIQATPLVAEMVGWRWAFAPLAIGPALGTLAMLRLRVLPAATAGRREPMRAASVVRRTLGLGVGRGRPYVHPIAQQ